MTSAALTFLVAGLLLYACGGGGGTGGTVTTGGATGGTTSSSGGGTMTGGQTTTSGTTGGPNVQVTIEPDNTACFTAAQVQFTAHVFGSPNTEVVWSVDGTNKGTIDQSGLYTAPNSSTSAVVRATSVANPVKFGIASVAVKKRATIQFFASPFGLEGLPTHEVQDVSENGLTAVGHLTGNPSTPAYWTSATGWVALPFPSGADDATVTNTADGDWMVGIARSGLGPYYAVRWSKSGTVHWILDNGGQKLEVSVDPFNPAVVCSNQASIVVGNAPVGTWRWRQGIGTDSVPLSLVTCISSNGVVVGGAGGAFPKFSGAIWTDHNGFQGTGGGSLVRALNAFGTIGAGFKVDPPGLGEFYWTGTVTSADSPNYIYLTADGQTLVHYGSDDVARFWSPGGAEVGVLQHLADNGLQTDLTGWRVLLSCYSSNDRRKIIGQLANASDQRKWFFANVP